MVFMRKTMTVNCPVEEVYAFWHEFENLPRVVQYLDSVQRNGNQFHWQATLPNDRRVEGDAQITEDRPNEFIAWQASHRQGFQQSGSVHFRPAPAGRGVEVSLDLDFNPPGGAIGEAVTRLLGAAPDMLAYKTLFQFKALMESGEIPTTKNQPAARDGGRDD
jgi:uncharacterized membrane protein